ncbi:DinG family ATP-dependent helicase YoaA [Candidatus Syntrophocurvum alkaliphilum]|uniref:DinG family ATP-dependent helicase YoaA n=1 Tax=Candidatus Syntrophocurvum alkaliphilum TaxID=2293317 RepID=A0A6I6DFU1_9FIRM|nr:ATP-dependent DNA helicase [Candidatus Syntrophocurvum alkaliphilum]QGT99251.1 DinG family ATP-dependent helicase YoaA [Candidatus Syntrophocurvum alkaliphilum]
MVDSHYQSIIDYLGPNGFLENKLKNFTYREEQLQLSEEVYKAFFNNEFLAAEVGTGVGKTYAYLISAIFWSIETGQKVIISTKTKALQQQINDRDLPLLKKVMAESFVYAEAKGRENYICWNKYMRILSGKKSLNIEEEKFITSILKWAEKTKTGDRKELSLTSNEMSRWYLVSADRKSCLKEKCFYHEKCFRLKMIKHLEKADLIIVNHALLLSDAIVDNSILPEYKHLIIDEAHTFDRESFDKLSVTLSITETLDILNSLISSKNSGYLFYLKNQFPAFSSQITHLIISIERQLEYTEALFNCFNQAFNYEKTYSYNHVLNNNDYDSEWFTELIDVYLEWQHNLNSIINELININEQTNLSDGDNDLTYMLNALIEIGDNAFIILEENLNKEDTIHWLNFNNGNVCELCSSIINVGNKIKEYVFKDLDSLIMLSATLTVNGDFNYFLKKNGLLEYTDCQRINLFLKESPFNYDKQAKMLLVEDIPDPSSPIFESEVVLALEETIKSLKGNILVLFTSRKQLYEVTLQLRKKLKNDNVTLLVQHEDGEFKTLIDKFTNTRSVLMGLDTYWEGLDLKGDILKCLIIVKLPFRSPSEPYSSSWEKYYIKEQKNSFLNYMLPDAAIKFKQGIGRLIRSENDDGIVVVLDTRLITKNYGKVIKDNSPIKSIEKISKQQIQDVINHWFK